MMTMKKRYVTPVAEAIALAPVRLLSGSLFEETNGTETGNSFVDGNETINPGNAL